jgi:hypothetical protein
MSDKPFVAEACPPMSHASASNGLTDLKTHIKNAPCNRTLSDWLHEQFSVRFAGAICSTSQICFNVLSVRATEDTKSHLKFAANCTWNRTLDASCNQPLITARESTNCTWETTSETVNRISTWPSTHLCTQLFCFLWYPWWRLVRQGVELKWPARRLDPTSQGERGNVSKYAKRPKWEVFFTHVRGIAQPKSKTIGAKLLVQKKVTPTLSSSLT